jgi:iron complex outermembrane recepter protein
MNYLSTRRALLVASLSSTILATTSTMVIAADETVKGDEIIVTAQKRSENLQKVPISIIALGTKKLEQLGIANFNDFTKQLPSVSFQTIQPGATTVYIRGVASGGDGNHSGPLPSVGVYLDEQPVTTIGGTLDVHIYDIARIEALAGPQGTLYGASSEAGTIRIITNKPKKGEFSAAVDAELNTVSNGSVGGKLEGYVNAPLGDNAALRLVGWYQHDAGFIDNVPGTRTFLPQPGGFRINNARFIKENYNDVDIAGGRAALKIDLDDNWTATASVFGQTQNAKGSFGFDPNVGDLKVQRFQPESNKDRFGQIALTIEGKIGNWDLTYAGAYMKRKRDTVSDYVDYAEAYDSLYASYGGIAGYFFFQDNAGNNILPVQSITASDTFTKISQELRIASPSDAPIRFVGGLFYQRQTNRINQNYLVAGLGAQVSVNGLPSTLWLTNQDRVDRDYAAFGEISYDVTDSVTLTGGLRGYKYENSLVGFFGFGRNPGIDPADGRPFTASPFNAAGSSRTGAVACLTPSRTLNAAVVPGSPCTNLGNFNGTTITPKSTKGDGFTYRANATWKVTDDHLLYATWSKGFRPGGINRRATLPPYAEDTLTNYELGFKTSWADGTVRFNGAIFMQNWKAFQFAFLGQNSFTELQNGPDARIQGVEVDAFWKPIDGFTLSGTAAFIDAKTKANLCATNDPTFECTNAGNFISAPKGTRLPVTPEFKGNITARYEFDFANAKTHVQASVVHQSSAASDLRTQINVVGTPANPAALTGRLAASTIADFTLGMDWDSFTAELFVNNAFDERSEISRYQQCSVCFQRPYVVPNTPRTIGLRVGAKF